MGNKLNNNYTTNQTTMKQTLFSIAALVALTHAARTKQTARPSTPTST